MYMKQELAVMHSLLILSQEGLKHMYTSNDIDMSSGSALASLSSPPLHSGGMMLSNAAPPPMSLAVIGPAYSTTPPLYCPN